LEKTLRLEKAVREDEAVVLLVGRDEVVE
jgi:hypothetical protein